MGLGGEAEGGRMEGEERRWEESEGNEGEGTGGRREEVSNCDVKRSSLGFQLGYCVRIFEERLGRNERHGE